MKDKEKLTDRENRVLQIMQARSGTLYIEGRPGEGKTAMIISIARKCGYNLVDLRLSSMDETDLGLYPIVEKMDGTNVVTFAVPHWAYEANKRPTILFFDELNRAPLANRNAALQILNERQIGPFKFNDGVLMVAAGNLGEADNTDVEEFDTALWGRLIQMKHDITVSEWVEAFAGANVWDVIVSYLSTHPEEAYKRSDNAKVYASYRSWTNMSNYLKSVLGDKLNTNSAHTLLAKTGSMYIGNSITKFLRYLEDMQNINVEDIITRFSQVKDQVSKFNRARLTELLTSLKQHKEFNKYKVSEVDNIFEFLDVIHADERMSYILHVFDAMPLDGPRKQEEKLFKRFPKEYEYIIGAIATSTEESKK